MLKAKLITSLGSLGLILFYMIGVLFAIAPLVILDTPFWLTFLLVIAINVIPLIGSLIEVVLWVWALIVAIGSPQDIFVIVFYVLFAINVVRLLSVFIPSLFVRD